MNLLSPDTSADQISDDELIQEFNYPSKYKRINLYALMSKRACHNKIIRDYLFEIVLNKETRSETIAGTVTHAWLPAIFILQYGDQKLKQDLKEILIKWSLKEKELFIDYIKSEEHYYSLLKDILSDESKSSSG